MKSALINVFSENLTEKAKEVYTALAFFLRGRNQSNLSSRTILATKLHNYL